MSCAFDARGQLLIIYCAFDKYCRKHGKHNEEAHQLFIDLKKPYYPVRRDVLYKILIEFGIPRKLVRLIKMSLTEIYTESRWVRICLIGSLLGMV